MSEQLLSLIETATRLKVRPEYVHQLVAKKRLSFVDGEQCDAAEVERLAILMDKLRHQGLATLVNINGQMNKRK